MAIITLAELKMYLNQIEQQPSPGPAESDTVLTAIIPRAESIVLGELGSDFVYAAYGAASQKAIYSDGTSALFLPPHQAGSVSAVRAGSATATPADTSIYYQDGGVLYLVGASGGYPTLRSQWQPGVYYVTAVWGYGPPTDDIKEVCLQVCVAIWQAKGQPIIGTEDHQFPLIAGLTKSQKAILANARRRSSSGVGIA